MVCIAAYCFEDSLSWLASVFMPLLCIFFKIHFNSDPVLYKNIGTQVSTQPDFCQLINFLLLDDLSKISSLLTLLFPLIMLVN
jgi:hypothetical protein